MGTVIRFPIEKRMASKAANARGPAAIVILPVIRIERHQEAFAVPVTKTPRSRAVTVAPNTRTKA
jgi:hypothetical protein